jgi:hypothetical protein
MKDRQTTKLTSLVGNALGIQSVAFGSLVVATTQLRTCPQLKQVQQTDLGQVDLLT